MVSLGDKKYQKGKIYFIGNYVDDDIYIGSTTQTLKKRFNKHKIQIDNEKTKHRKLYAKMIEMGVEHFTLKKLKNALVMMLKNYKRENYTTYWKESRY